MIFGVFVIFGGLNNAVNTRLKNIKLASAKSVHKMTLTEVYRSHQINMGLNLLLILAFLFVAAGIFTVMEDWTFIKGLYFAVQTTTTIGYGDMVLKHNGTNAVLMVYILSSTVLVFFAVNNFRTLHEDFSKLKESIKMAEKKKALAILRELDTGKGVPMDTFILAVLEQLGTLDRARDIEPWVQVREFLVGSGFFMPHNCCCCGRY
jgi:hypothetical protein